LYEGDINLARQRYDPQTLEARGLVERFNKARSFDEAFGLPKKRLPPGARRAHKQYWAP